MSHQIFIAGVGMIPFSKPGASDSYDVMGATATRLAEPLGFRVHSQSEKPNGCLSDGMTICDICRIFGAAQVPGNLYFENAVVSADIQKVIFQLDRERRDHQLTPRAALSFGQNIRTNVAIDRRTHTSLADHLFSTESVGSPVIFNGSIRSEKSMPVSLRDAALLVSALQFIDHLGGGRGRGLGRCEIRVDDLLMDGASKLDQLAVLLESGEVK